MRYLLFCFIILATGKLNAQTFQWAKTISADSNVYWLNIGMCTDPNNNVYTIGTYKGTVDFDPSSNTLFKTAQGGTDFYISKLDSNGSLIWVHSFGSQARDLGYSIEYNNGFLYCTGAFDDSLDFDPSNNVYKLPADSGGHSAYVLKLDTTGNFVWVSAFHPSSNGFPFVPTGSAVGYSLKIDTKGDVIIKGAMSGQIDFDPSGSIYNVGFNSGNSLNSFIVKLNPAGQLIWAKRIDAQASHSVRGLAIGPNNSIYSGGQFEGAGDFDPGPGNYTLQTTGFLDYDAYLLSLDSNGIFNWAFSFGNANSNAEIVDAIDVQSNGNIIISGTIGDNADLDPSSNNYNLISPNNSNSGFIASYSTLGNFNWAKTIGGFGYLKSRDVLIDSLDNIFVVGNFDSIADFDPSSASYNLPTQGNWDAFLAKYNSSGNFIMAKSWGGHNWENAFNVRKSQNGNLYIHGLYNSNLGDFDPTAGIYLLDSIKETNIFVLKIRDSSINYHKLDTFQCDSLFFEGKMYYSSNSFTKLYNNLEGYDSNKVVNIIIQSSELYRDSILSCEPIFYGGQVIGASGVYNQVFTSAQGCDSNVILYFINSRPNSFILHNGLALSDTNSGATYQWLNCNPYSTITGATNQTYTVTANGDYAVVVTQNGCSDTSNCISITNVGINDIERKGISVYPNPSSGTFVINSTINLDKASFKVLNTLGKIVYQQNNVRGNYFEINLAAQAAGFYTLEISEYDKVSRLKLLKR